MNRPAAHAGHGVVVSDADTPSGAATARSLAAAGAAVVCVGDDAAALGALAGSLADGGARAAVYAGSPTDGAITELVAELFADPPIATGADR